MKIHKHTRKKSKSGFGMVELLVSAGLLGFIGVAISTLGVNVFQMQRKSILTSETNEFSSSLGYYLKQNCHEEFKGETFPGTSDTPLVIHNYKGFGESLNVSEIETDTLFEGKWKVNSLTWKDKGIPAQNYKREGDDYELVIATISLQSEIINPSDNTKMERLPPYHIEIPFLIEPGTRIIEDCMSAKGLSGKDICTIIGAVYDESTETCLPDRNCFLLTQFVDCEKKVELESDGKTSKPTETPSPCDELVKPELMDGSEEHYYNYHNEDSSGSCPTETDMILSGEVRRKGQKRYGKGNKRVHTYYATGKIYLCMKCPALTPTP